MPAYVVAMMSIEDAETYRKYTDRTPPIVKKYGGRFLTRGEPIASVEGEAYDGRMVLLEFPSKSDVDAWYADPEYQDALQYRRAGSTMHRLLIQESAAVDEAPDPHL
ncbi:MAG: DUF1330 domain-containing protein [Pseudomonadota bacterium]